MPITTEPIEPAMCHKEWFMNLWIKDHPFHLDYITDLPYYKLWGIFRPHLMTKVVTIIYTYTNLVPHSSWPSVGRLEFSYTTLLFGWKASMYIYHNISLAATSFTHFHGVPCLQYIDDRHCSKLCLHHESCYVTHSGYSFAEMVAFIAYVLLFMGYFVGLKNSVLLPSTAVRFLGYVSDGLKQAVILPEDKSSMFASLQDNILARKSVLLKNL